ncbi:MAG: hypothetical protein KDA25_06915, partial [Phycisphaerales bacterium]|nr:hypothetical protein [Phycisphaerales bacterium]
FERLRGDANAQLQHLVTLQQNAGSDLGHRDAEVFVTALLKGRAAEIRATAESILGQRFANGPVVVLELLDQFTDALPRQSVSDLIAQITGDVLPPLRATGWRFAARTALTRHALALRSDRLAEVDDTAGRVRESCESQLSILRRHSAVSMASRSAHEAAERLASEWREQARGRTPREPVPGPFATIERRQATIAQLAAGPIERYVAARLATLEWLAFVTADEAPGLRTRIGRLLDDATASRRETTHILDQAFEVDLAIARLWLVRIGLGRALDAALAEGGGS